MPPSPKIPPSRVLVIGAGVAGSTAAIRFAHLGSVVTLVERAVFPREKICGCCLGAAGLQALDAITLGDQVRQMGTPTDLFVGYFQTARSLPTNGLSTTGDCAVPIRLSIATGVAISRSVLDSFLVDQAQQAGVRVWQPCEAQVVSTDTQQTLIRYRHTISSSVREGNSPVPNGWQLTEEFDLVVVAAGLSGNFFGSRPSSDAAQPGQRWQLPWIQLPHGPLGIAAHLPGDHPLARDWKLANGEIQMVCGDEGYVGLVRLPGGEIDIAAALRSRRKRSGDTIDRLTSLLRSHPELSNIAGDRIAVWLRDDATLITAPPLRRTRSPGRHGVVLIGDSAGYVEPMTGEGMTWGIESGLAVADLWVNRQRQHDFATLWQKRLRSLQRKRRILCGGVTQAMRLASLRRAAHFGLTHAPWLATPITHGLATGPRFQPSAGKLS